MRAKRNPPTGEVEGHKTNNPDKVESNGTQEPSQSNRKPRERWRVVKGSKGVKVSTRGRVKGAEVRTHEGRRYACGRSVARMVFETFRERVPAGLELHHLDGNRANDSLDNLIALSPSEHAKADGRRIRIRFEPWVIAEAYTRARRGEHPDAIFEATSVSWRHQRHLIRNRDRRAALVCFLETGVHFGGQLDLFGRGGASA